MPCRHFGSDAVDLPAARRSQKIRQSASSASRAVAHRRTPVARTRGRCRRAWPGGEDSYWWSSSHSAGHMQSGVRIISASSRPRSNTAAGIPRSSPSGTAVAASTKPALIISRLLAARRLRKYSASCGVPLLVFFIGQPVTNSPGRVLRNCFRPRKLPHKNVSHVPAPGPIGVA